jgi:ribonucleoside-diphosphate reductase alpha chain
VVAIFTRMLDNVVEINGLPLEQQRQEIFSKRRHGMGYLGLGSTLTMLGMKYGSPESLFSPKKSPRNGPDRLARRSGTRSGKGPAPILEQDSPSLPKCCANVRKWPAMAFKAGDTLKVKCCTPATADTCSKLPKSIRN